MFPLGTENAMGGGWVGITYIPNSRTRGPSGLGLGEGKIYTGPPDSRIRGSSAPTVLVIYIILKNQRVQKQNKKMLPQNIKNLNGGSYNKKVLNIHP